jgi:rhamnosyltransferase
MTTSKNPIFKVIILMACYNGKAYVAQQIESIAQQKNCAIKLVISVDLSDDGTFDYIKDLSRQYTFIQLLSYGYRYGSAAANFYRLICEADIQGHDFIAFSDQDDIWNDDKLINHINLAKKYQADGVSSNVLAIWPNGQQKIITKSDAQTQYDYLFESAGPGCTYLLTPWLTYAIKQLLDNPTSAAKQVELHDWLSYAVCRAHGKTWIIDNQISLKYRQHTHNVFGANSGFRAVKNRLSLLKNGWYKNEVIKITNICDGISADPFYQSLLSAFNKKGLASRFTLLSFCGQARRKMSERIFLMGCILFGFLQ